MEASTITNTLTDSDGNRIGRTYGIQVRNEGEAKNVLDIFDHSAVRDAVIAFVNREVSAHSFGLSEIGNRRCTYALIAHARAANDGMREEIRRLGGSIGNALDAMFEQRVYRWLRDTELKNLRDRDEFISSMQSDRRPWNDERPVRAAEEAPTPSSSTTFSIKDEGAGLAGDDIPDTARTKASTVIKALRYCRELNNRMTWTLDVVENVGKLLVKWPIAYTGWAPGNGHEGDPGEMALDVDVDAELDFSLGNGDFRQHVEEKFTALLSGLSQAVVQFEEHTVNHRNVMQLITESNALGRFLGLRTDNVRHLRGDTDQLTTVIQSRRNTLNQEGTRLNAHSVDSRVTDMRRWRNRHFEQEVARAVRG